MREVRAALEYGCLGRPVGRGHRVGQARVVEQLVDRDIHRVAVERVGVLVAQDHERLAGLQPARLPLVIVMYCDAGPGVT